ADRLLQLRLRHLRAAADAALTRFVVELFLGTPAGTAVRTQAAPPARRDVVDRRTARGHRLAGPRALLVDGARGDLLRGVLVLTALFEAFLDVFVLPLAFGTPLRS